MTMATQETRLRGPSPQGGASSYRTPRRLCWVQRLSVLGHPWRPRLWFSSIEVVMATKSSRLQPSTSSSKRSGWPSLRSRISQGSWCASPSPMPSLTLLPQVRVVWTAAFGRRSTSPRMQMCVRQLSCSRGSARTSNALTRSHSPTSSRTQALRLLSLLAALGSRPSSAVDKRWVLRRPQPTSTGARSTPLRRCGHSREAECRRKRPLS
mmetsp:Transcript_24472/g.60456  ORF Transcript_24472/g.60456 Transcript_24472/m.60456 type:complete len:209 (-) Transcript_24472:725-1351(-)